MITNSVLTSSPTSIYTSIGNNAVVVIHLCNNTGANVTANVYCVPSGGTADANTQIYSLYTILSHDTMIIDREKFFLENGDSIQAEASTTDSVTATVNTTGL